MNVKVELSSHTTVTKVVRKRLGRLKAWGMADDATGIIYIDPRCAGRKELEIITHESLHILLPFLNEETISRIGSELTRVLWSEGYRKTDNDTSQPLQTEQD